LVGGGGEIIMAPVNFVSEKLVPTHKHAVRAKNRVLDFGRNLPRTLFTLFVAYHPNMIFRFSVFIIS
jgi:hypothetical protein